MKYSFKKVYLILLLLIILSPGTKTYSKDTNFKYTKEDISNYFSGIVSLSKYESINSYSYLKKIESIDKTHSNYNLRFIQSLVLLNKFNEAFSFSKKVWNKDTLLFEADLLLGLQSYIKKDYQSAIKYFERLNKIPRYNFFFEDFFGNILMSWVKASENNQKASFEFVEKIPKRYEKLKIIQNSFLHCYFDTLETEIAFKKIIEDKNNSFSRYNYFLTNYLISKKKIHEAKIFAEDKSNSYNSNLLIKQTANFINTKKSKKINNFFNCKNNKDSIAEIFYIVANMYSTQKEYTLSNFYLNISLFLNSKFTPNKTLLAENLYYQKKFKLSKKTYQSIKKIGPIYSWYAAKSIASILSKTKSEKDSILYLKKQFNLLPNLNFEHYYELANFYKDAEYFEDSIKYYSLTLKNIEHGHDLIPKILDRRGTSHERNGNWKEAEKDLIDSLRILPDQPYVLNYLAYTWIEKKINIEKALNMLKRAVSLKKNDGYIIDSLGWAYFVTKNYIEAEKFLQHAVQLKPLDPIINDHYADSLWMRKKTIQAVYFWNHVLNLDTVKEETKKKINNKLIFGITNNL